MTVAIVGGLNRLNEQYAKLAKEENLDLRVFNCYSPSLSKRIVQSDGVILFTNLISHKAARHVYKLARDNKINLICRHNCSISAVQSCIAELKNSDNACRCDSGCGSACGGGSCGNGSGGCKCTKH